jgi:uncharacterized protein
LKTLRFIMQLLPECQLILNKLKNELPANLYYHSIDHTLEVYNCAASIAKEEGVSDSDLKLLLFGAIYHDAGYLIHNEDHEQLSFATAREYLNKFNYTKEDIELICGIIMATKIPQSPKSHLEEIICDADLNYLGRIDFFGIGENLYKERSKSKYKNNN